METIFDKQSSTNARLKVVVKEEDYAKDHEKSLKDYAKTARIKGFRPGHVPLGYVKKLYGRSILVDLVLKKVSSTVNEYIAENKLRVVGDPMPDNASKQIDFDKDKEFTFDYDMGLATDFEIDLEKIPAIENFKIIPSDEQVDKAVEDLQKRFGDDLEPEESEIGDLVFGKLTQTSSEFETQSGIPSDKVKKKNQKLFKGLEKGSSISFDIQDLFETDQELGFAIGKSDEEAKALSGEFTFEVDKLSRVAPAKIDQALFDKAIGEGKAKNEAEFREEVKKVISENYNRESDYLLDYDIEKALINSVKIDLPDEFLKKWLIQINEGKFTAEDVEKDYEAFAKGLRADLIKTEIASDNDLKVGYDEVLEEVKAEILNYFGPQAQMQGMESFIDEMARKQLSENKDEVFRKHYNKAYGRKVIEFAKTKVKTKDKEVKVEEFNEIAKSKYDAAK